ncbi:MAG: M4 family metallopeptidase [Thermoanaerobaculia bacterium]
MCEALTPCHPINCIVPPHLVETLKLRGDDKIREMCAALEKHSADYRQSRSAAVPGAAALAGLQMAVAAAPVVVKPDREVYDAQNKARLPGVLERDETTGASSDKAVNDAFNGAGDTFKLFWEVYGRNSLDGAGMTMVSTVHYRSGYNNAFWNGLQMAYGDGDGLIFRPFTGDRSVIGHELSHGVVQFSGGLVYRDQSGTLNESFADVFGVLSVQYKKGQSASEASWLVGDNLLGPGINGTALRSMKAPGTAYDDPILGTDPQPYHMDLYVHTSSDNGGVHINSGIPNHAFYLLANYLGGQAWETAGQIWYDTMQQLNSPTASFADWADKTVEVAGATYGSGSMEQLFTRRAWRLVGISL